MGLPFVVTALLMNILSFTLLLMLSAVLAVLTFFVHPFAPYFLALPVAAIVGLLWIFSVPITTIILWRNTRSPASP